MEQISLPQVIAEQQWQQWQERSEEQSLDYAFDDAFVQTLLQVWEGSDYVVQTCQRSPEFLITLHQSGDLDRSYAEGEMAAALKAQLAGVQDELALQKVLRLYRRREMVRIIWRDLARLAPLSEVLEDLSELADVCVDQALDILYSWAVEKQGCHGMLTVYNSAWWCWVWVSSGRVS